MRGFPLTALLFAVSATPAAFGGGTPDGETPAQETVCDGQVGAAHGLCTAYCEAMDCDNPDHTADDKACQSVRDNFIKHTGVVPPCESGNGC